MMMKPVRETVSSRNGVFWDMGVNWRDYWPIGALLFFRLGDWDMTHFLLRRFWHHVIYVIWLVDEG